MLIGGNGQTQRLQDMLDNHKNTVTSKSKRIRDCSITVAECLAVLKAIVMIIRKSQRIIIHSY